MQPKYRADDQHLGSNGHMWVRMDLTRFAENELIEQTLYRFSITAAVSELLSTLRLDQIDPTILGLREAGAVIDCNIANRHTDETILQLGFSRPGHGAGSEQPGIFLHTDYTSDLLRAMTGLPFPAGKNLLEKDVIILANYNNDFTQLIPTPAYEQLKEAADRFLAHQPANLVDELHELVYKGVTRNGSITGLPEGTYVEQHFYDNAKDVVLQLALTNLEHFNPGKVDHSLRHHRFAYSRDHLGNFVALIDTISIDEADHGLPNAGIWLTSANNSIEDLSLKTGVDFTQTMSYKSGMNVVQLGRYTYDNGYEVVANEPTLHYFQQLHQSHGAAQQEHRDRYSLEKRFAFNATGEDSPYPAMVDQHFHFRSFEQALEQLAFSEFWLMGLDRHPPGQQHLQDVVVKDPGDRVLATIYNWMGADGNTFLQLVLSDKVAERSAAVWEGLQPFFMPDAKAGSNMRLIPIGYLESSSGRLVYTKEYKDIAAVISSVAASSRNLHAESIAVSGQFQQPTDPLTISLVWNKPPAEDQVLTQALQVPDLQGAHDYLLRMDEKLFVPDPKDVDRPFILRAILQNKEGGDLAIRFYRHPTHPDAQEHAGMYLQYAKDDQAQLLKESAISRGLIGDALKDEASLFRQLTHPPLSADQRPRERFFPDDGVGRCKSQKP